MEISDFSDTLPVGGSTDILMDNFEHWYARIHELERQSNVCARTKKQEGITYTPAHVVDHMISLLDLHDQEVVHEMSCGRGMFVIGLVKHWRLQGKTWPWIHQWAQNFLRCADTDAAAISDLQTLWTEMMSIHLGEDPIPLRASVEDGLFGPLSQQSCDVVVGNPPYVRVQHLQEQYRQKVRNNYSTCAKGNVDLYYAFIQHALEKAKRMCLITPNSWMSNQSAKQLRHLIAPRLSHVIDFQSQLIFAPVRAYTSIMMCGPDLVSMLSFSNTMADQWQHMDKSQWVDFEKLLLPWMLPSPSHSPHVLSDHFDVFSGLATLSDKSYILPSPTLSADQKYVLQKDPLDANREARIPIEFAPILIKATEGKEKVGRQRIIFPYRNGKIVPEHQLQQDAPDLLAWLSRRRPKLEERDKGKTQKYDSWYAYGRRQGLHDISGSAVVVPQMGNGALHPFEVTVASPQDRFVFTSGYVLVPKSPQMTLPELMAHLSSSLMWDYVKVHGRAWAGKGDYRTLGAKDLRQAPMPPVSPPSCVGPPQGT